MFRLTVCCLVLGAALANPVEKASGTSAEWDYHVVSSKEGTLHSERVAIEVESRGLSDDPQPLPEPTTTSTDLKEFLFYILDPGLYYFTSRNYPFNYNNNDYFAFIVTGSSSQLMQVDCNPFNVESHPTCSYDWLRINANKYCGTGSFTVSSTQFTIEFSSDFVITRTGFYCLIAVP